MGYSQDYDQDEGEEVLDYKEQKADTIKAILFLFIVPHGNGRTKEMEVWLPKSQIQVDEKTKEVTMPKWLYRKNFQ